MTKFGDGYEFDDRYAESKHHWIRDTDKAEDDLEAINEWDEH